LVESETGRRIAIRDFALGLGGISFFAVIPGYFLTTSAASPFSIELYRTVLLGLLVLGWSGGVASLLASFYRDITPVQLTEHGILAGRRLFPYSEIASIDDSSHTLVFRLVMRKGKRLALSKIGIQDEHEFFERLSNRVRGS
jgi:hypothetical protein